jgi:hypothetical protein
MLGGQTAEVNAGSWLPVSEGKFERLTQQLGGLGEGSFVRSIVVVHRLPNY